MISIIGNGLLITTLLLNGLNSIIGRKLINTKNFLVNCIIIFSSYLLLIVGFIQADFSIKNIFLNSALQTPTIYKISAAWSSHEGSILLWTLLIHVFNTIGMIRVPISRKSSYITIASLIQFLFTAYIYFVSNPFSSSSYIPSDGLGLNPMLQDIALVIHPPTLYIGNTILSVCFITACTNFICNKNILKLTTERIDIKDDDLEQSNKVIKDFVTISLIFLSIGIGLGSWWAYRELGWGGFWFFDPIENISLLPWFGSIILFHSFYIKNIHTRQNFINWISIITFLTVIFGTCLVRSGVLDSIHSFAASSDRAIFLSVIFFVICCMVLWIVIKYPVYHIQTNQLGYRDQFLILSNGFWFLCIFIISLSVILPIFFSVILKKNFSLDSNFFLISFVPLVLTNVFLMALLQMSNLKTIIIFTIVFFLTIVLLFLNQNRFNFISIFAITIGIVVVLNTIILLIRKNYLKSKKNFTTNAGYFSHVGFGILILAIVLNCNLRQEMEFSGKLGDSLNYKNFTITLKNIKYADGINYYRQIAEFWIIDRNGFLTILLPENRLYKNEKVLSQESNVYSYLFYDIYGVLSRIDDKIVNGKIYYQPFISFIWLGILLITNGLIIRIFSPAKKLRNGWGGWIRTNV